MILLQFSLHFHEGLRAWGFGFRVSGLGLQASPKRFQGLEASPCKAPANTYLKKGIDLGEQSSTFGHPFFYPKRKIRMSIKKVQRPGQNPRPTYFEKRRIMSGKFISEFFLIKASPRLSCRRRSS